MSCSDLTIGMVGSGGDGVVAAGELLVASAAMEGLYGLMVKSFGPQIRGGESSCRVRVSNKPVPSQGDRLDLLVSFSWQEYNRFKSELLPKKGCIVICDEKDGIPDDQLPIDKGSNPTIYRVPLEELALESAKTTLAKNIVVLGLISQIAGYPEGGIVENIRKKFGRKGEKVVKSNMDAFQAGKEFVISHPIQGNGARFEYAKGEPKIVITGNEALAYGSLYAGCRFFAGYPITPSSEVMEWLQKELPRFGGIFVQAEDEISSIGMVVGASFAGRKAMTATSGPGLSLMMEILGLASISEVPCVIADVQRVGPSTGIPTKSEQSDLAEAVYGSHGDAPRAVLAPCDVEDCFDMAYYAFYIAEKYQTPVIILSDQYLGHRKDSINRIDLTRFKSEVERGLPSTEGLRDYRRFRETEDGVSPMAIPGMAGGQYTAAGIEHNEIGYPTSVEEIHERMNEKRYKKLKALGEEIDFAKRLGPHDAEVGVLAWGSTKGAVEEALEKLNRGGHKVAAFIPQILYPMPIRKLKEFLAPMKKVLIVEMSYSGQFEQYVRSQVRLPLDTFSYKRSGAAPFSPEEIYDKIVEVI